ncbi:hypothetical protein ACCO45_008465 [Purpureocillium lilacinum]|uniref:Uncharacterized protein n=1 Tax=Purpureocillium lilacinum TaxID=33203 RepID=A0ACC4DPX5_PURLI
MATLRTAHFATADRRPGYEVQRFLHHHTTTIIRSPRLLLLVTRQGSDIYLRPRKEFPSHRQRAR